MYKIRRNILLKIKNRQLISVTKAEINLVAKIVDGVVNIEPKIKNFVCLFLALVDINYSRF